ncbi:MAG: hypothetical protein HY675_26990 [Chloroflexi bacterium]|nr:hypothetical protein [Chloroflexota bacterium]
MSMRNILICIALALAVIVVVPMIAGAAPLDQPAIPHTLEGRSACTSCHTVGGAGAGAPGGTGLPANHQGRTDAVCTGCHQVAAAKPAAQPTAAPKPAAQPTAAPKPAAQPTAAPKPAAQPTAAPKPAAQPTAAPKPAAAPTPPAAALPRTGEGPSTGLLILVAMVLVAIGWGIRKLVASR